MTCQKCEQWLAQGESAGAAAGAAVEQHLRECPACRLLADDLRANAQLMAMLRDEPLPAVELRSVRTSRVRPLVWAAAAAATVVVALTLPRWGSKRELTPLTAHVDLTPSAPVIARTRPNVHPPKRVPLAHARRSFNAPRAIAHAALGPQSDALQPQQTLLVKMLTPDPDVVIYWLVDSTPAQSKRPGPKEILQ